MKGARVDAEAVALVTAVPLFVVFPVVRLHQSCVQYCTGPFSLTSVGAGAQCLYDGGNG